MDFLTFKVKQTDTTAPNLTSTNPISPYDAKLKELSLSTNEDASVFVDITLEDFESKAKETESNKGGFWNTIAKLGEEKIKELFAHLDKNNDGKLSEDEISEYSIIDSDETSLSLMDLKEVFSKMGLELSADTDELTNNVENALNNDDSITPDASQATAQPATPAQGASNASSPQRANSSNQSYNNQQPTIDPNSIEGLEAQKVTAQNNLKTAQDDVSKINNGTSDKVSSEKTAMDEAKKAQDDAIKNDKQISDELKQQKTENDTAIQTKETEISEQETKLSEAQNSISQIDNQISNLESALSSLPAPTPDTTDENGNTIKGNTETINARKDELNSQISTKKEEKTAQETKRDEAQQALTKAQEELTQLKATQVEIDNKIKETAGEKTKEAMKAYTDAKQAFETKKTSALNEAQSTINKENTTIKELDSKIETLKNEKAAEKPGEYNKDKGEKFADVARKAALNRNTVGMCLGGVNDAMDNMFGVGELPRQAHAYMAIDDFQNSKNFKEITPPDQLSSLPAGAVVVWTQGSSPSGHISVALGNGQEASDHIQTQLETNTIGKGRQPHVFIPV